MICCLIVTYITSLLTFVIENRPTLYVVIWAQAKVICYKIGRIEYSHANVFFASIISNLFYAFGKQEELQSHVKGQIPKRDCKCELMVFPCLEKFGSKYIFVSRTRVRSCSRDYDFVSENWISGCRFYRVAWNADAV